MADRRAERSSPGTSRNSGCPTTRWWHSTNVPCGTRKLRERRQFMPHNAVSCLDRSVTCYLHPITGNPGDTEHNPTQPLDERSQCFSSLTGIQASEALDDRCVRHAAALAHRLQAIVTAGRIELVEHCRHETGAR